MGDINQTETTLHLGLSKCITEVIFFVYLVKYSHIEIVSNKACRY